LIDCRVATDGGKVRAEGGALSGDHVAGGALAWAKEVLAAGDGVAGQFGLGGGGIEGDDECYEAIESWGWKIEAGHAGGGDDFGDDVTEVLWGAAAEPEIAGEARALL